jgi:hypothetical protein
VANLLIANRSNRVVTFNGVTVLRLEDVFRLFRKPLGPAIDGFQTSSVALKNIGTTKVPSHAVCGTEPALSFSEGALDLLIKLFIDPGKSVDNLMGGEGAHDTIVPVSSQRGGVTPDATSTIPSVVHANLYFLPGPSPLLDTSETESLAVHAEVSRLLNASVLSSDFNNEGFPAFAPTETNGISPYDSSQQSESSQQTGLSFDTSGVATLTPVPGTVVQPGSSVPISLILNGGNAVSGAFFILDDLLYHVDGAGPFSFSYTVPADKAGRLDITAFTHGPGPDNYLASTYIVVNPSSPPESLTATPGDLLFDQIGGQVQLTVTGKFADGSELDLTPSDAGTSVRKG